MIVLSCAAWRRASWSSIAADSWTSAPTTTRISSARTLCWRRKRSRGTSSTSGWRRKKSGFAPAFRPDARATKAACAVSRRCAWSVRSGVSGWAPRARKRRMPSAPDGWCSKPTRSVLCTVQSRSSRNSRRRSCAAIVWAWWGRTAAVRPRSSSCCWATSRRRAGQSATARISRSRTSINGVSSSILSAACSTALPTVLSSCRWADSSGT